jgi:DNA-binding MarR family transcriptional regulator
VTPVACASGVAARVTLGSMSQTVRRLEATRLRDEIPRDGGPTQVLFALTEQGRAAATASRRHRRDWLNGRLAELTAAERDDLAQVTASLLRIADS